MLSCMTIRAFIQNVVFLIPVLITYFLYAGHKNGNGANLVLYGKPNQTLGIWLFISQIVFTLILLIFFHLYKKGAQNSFIFLFKSFLFLISLGVPIFINDWAYCNILCYIATVGYTVVSACVLALIFIFSVYRSTRKPPKADPSQTSLQV